MEYNASEIFKEYMSLIKLKQSKEIILKSSNVLPEDIDNINNDIKEKLKIILCSNINFLPKTINSTKELEKSNVCTKLIELINLKKIISNEVNLFTINTSLYFKQYMEADKYEEEKMWKEYTEAVNKKRDFEANIKKRINKIEEDIVKLLESIKKNFEIDCIVELLLSNMTILVSYLKLERSFCFLENMNEEEFNNIVIMYKHYLKNNYEENDNSYLEIPLLEIEKNNKLKELIIHTISNSLKKIERDIKIKRKKLERKM